MNLSYTLKDHSLRRCDPYANAKYSMTLRWLSGHIGKDASLINVGCGSGDFTETVSHLGFKVIACEPEFEAFKLARNLLSESVELLNCGIGELAELGYSAETVVMHDVLEHIEDDKAAAADLAKLVKVGGRAIVSVPALMSLFGRHDVELGHYRRYTIGSLSDVLRDFFEIERIQYYNLSSIPLVLWYSKLMKRSYPAAGSDDSYLARVYSMLCTAETNWSPPRGTAILAKLKLKSS